MTTIQKLDFISNKYFGKKYEVLDREKRDFVFSIYLSKYATEVLSPKRVN